MNLCKPLNLLIFFLLLLQLPGCNRGHETPPENITTNTPASAAWLGVIVNDSDPLSRRIASYYMTARGIPAENLVHVNFTPGSAVMRPEIFKALKTAAYAATPKNVQAYALTWMTPYRVGCMSITTAFAAGFNEEFCVLGCKHTKRNPYFNSNSHSPWDDFGLRPTIMLAGETFEDVKTLIDRGVAADHTNPKGTAYLVRTTDRARNARARFYHGTVLMQSDRFRLNIIKRNTLQHRNDVMFYFTGLKKVDGISTNTFLPGSIADHLTSTGGKLTGSTQMSSVRWLEAGATGSYGAVVEPCAFVEKFPRPDIVIDHYLDGESLIESYWKSVEMPGQGVFIGEPLATPFNNTPD